MRAAAPDYQPGGLLRFQRAWVDDPCAVAIIAKSRQIGITYASALRAVLLAAPQHRPGNVYYTSHTEEVGREFIGDVTAWCRAMEQVVSRPREQLVRHPAGDYSVLSVRLANGRTVMALPGIPRALRGRRGHVIIDEAAYLDDLNGMLKAAGAMLMRGWTLRLISTHRGRGAFYELWKSATARGWRQLRISLADAKRAGLYRQICASLGRAWTAEGEAKWERDLRLTAGDAAGEEYDCIPAEDGAAYLPAHLVRQRMVRCPIVRERWGAADTALPDGERSARITGLLLAELAPVVARLIPGRRRYLGWDVARDPEGDPIVGVVIEETHQGRYQPVAMLEFRGLPYAQQIDAIIWLWEAMRLAGCAVDSTGVGSAVGDAVALRWPERGHAVPMTAPWYNEWLPIYRDDLEAGRMLIPRHEDVATDHRLVEVREGKPRIAKQRAGSSDGGQRHGDSVIALALARCAAGMDPHYPDWTGDAVQSARPGALEQYDPRPTDWDEDDALTADPWAV